MRCIDAPQIGVRLLEPDVYGDERGFFMETWNARRFVELSIPETFVQDNHSRSRQGTLRGLHYQIRQPQGKLVRVTQGEVYDVAVDIRRHSPTFGRWYATTLSAQNRRVLWVPPGMAHGFLVLSDTAEFLYRCTDYWAPEYERTIAWNDPSLGIPWPLGAGQAPLLSLKDAAATPFADAQVYP